MSEPGQIFSRDFPSLFPEHVRQLRDDSGIADDVIRERGYRSVLGRKALADLGFSRAQQRTPGLLMPVHTGDGSSPFAVFRPDMPRTNRDGKTVKYEMPTRLGMRIDVPPRCRSALSDPNRRLYITEGIKKADAGASHGLCIVALLGVSSFRGRNDLGGVTWLADWQCIALNDRRVDIVYDSDVMTKPAVQRALVMLTEMLTRKGANVRHVYLPTVPNGEKVGLDDFLLTHSVDDLKRHAVIPVVPTEPKTPNVVHKLSPGDDKYLTDLGNAKRLVAKYGTDIRYCYAWGKFLVYDGKRWGPDDKGQVVRWAKEITRFLLREAATAKEKGQARAVAEWALTSQSATRINAMVKLAESEEGVPVVPGELDRDGWLLNVENGTIDLRTGQLRGYRRQDLITKLAPVTYDPTATAPIWEQFLATVLPDEAVRAFVQRAAGYSLTGDVGEQALFFPHGAGANGKSTFLGALQETLGDYAKQAAPDLLLAKQGQSHPTELADLFGIRFLATVEVEEGRRMAEALVKQLTGGDRIKARRMREDFWEFAPTHKIWLAANHKPEIRGTDNAIWRRIKLIPFDVTIPPEGRDRTLPAKLSRERSGILNWLIEGCLAWQRNGLGEPEAIRKATLGYRNEMDALGTFFEECCIIKDDAIAPAASLYTVYRSWCNENGEKPESQKKLAGGLHERGLIRLRNKKTGRFEWAGIGLLVPTPASDPPILDGESLNHYASPEPSEPISGINGNSAHERELYGKKVQMVQKVQDGSEKHPEKSPSSNRKTVVV